MMSEDNFHGALTGQQWRLNHVFQTPLCKCQRFEIVGWLERHLDDTLEVDVHGIWKLKRLEVGVGDH